MKGNHTCQTTVGWVVFGTKEKMFYWSNSQFNSWLTTAQTVLSTFTYVEVYLIWAEIERIKKQYRATLISSTTYE
jgi:hypothetical protein